MPVTLVEPLEGEAVEGLQTLREPEVSLDDEQECRFPLTGVLTRLIPSSVTAGDSDE